MTTCEPPVSLPQDAARPLSLCPSGCRATIDIEDLEPKDRSMLEALGIEHGCEVEVCKVGSPCIVKVSSTRLGVGREVAARIRATVTTAC